MMSEPLDADLKQKFKALDADGSGTLDYPKFSSLLRAGNADMSDQELRLVFDAVCVPGRGSVRFDDLVDFLCGPPQSRGHEPEPESRGHQKADSPTFAVRSLSPPNQERDYSPTKILSNANPQETFGSMKVYDTGLTDGPIPVSKRGKGVQHLNSSYWLQDLACFIAANLGVLRDHVSHVEHATREYQYRHLLNQSNVLMMEAEKSGLRSPQALEQWLMASWLAMAAAEVDSYDFKRYTPEQRAGLRQVFFDEYKQATPRPAPHSPPAPLGATPPGRAARMDLIPKVALERLEIQNELMAVKKGERANAWMIEGERISKRVDSIKRHFDEAHKLQGDVDEVTHIVWNFMCIYHAAKVFPNMNDLPDFETLSRAASPSSRTNVRFTR